jgi:hypothetical protein
MAAALLESGLTVQEIREIAIMMVRDVTFNEQFAGLVSAIANSISLEYPQKHVSVGLVHDAPPGNPITRIIESTGISKRDMIASMQRHMERGAEWNPNPRHSQRQIIEEFLRVAPEEVVQKVSTDLAHVAGPDPYMDELMDRKVKFG